jgi:hypothetical protein
MRVDRWWVGRLGWLAARLGHRRVEGQELGHELAEHVTVVAAEVVEAVVGDGNTAAQPAVGRVEPTSRAIWRPEPTPSLVA